MKLREDLVTTCSVCVYYSCSPAGSVFPKRAWGGGVQTQQEESARSSGEAVLTQVAEYHTGVQVKCELLT